MKRNGEHLKELTEDEKQFRLMWAGFAMQSLLVVNGMAHPNEGTAAMLAESSFVMADAMLEASRK